METSADAQNWHHDARYFYYPHGPLQRVELGEHLVQGTDYAYTLQGWLKGINGDRLNPTTDMGRDGDATVVGNPNLLTGRDAYALSLGYYGDNDYKAIASSYDSDSPANIAQRPFAPIGGVGTMNTEHTPLYNGNIVHTVNTLQHFGLWDATNGDQGQVLAMVYRYDQLNRLRTARGVIGLGTTNTWNTVADAATNRYRSEYTYDANGNIESVERYDADGTGHYDSFAYHYHTNGGRKQQNRLYELIDAATMNTGSDIVTTATGFDNTSNGVNVNNNYGYDALGNLVRDDREDIELIHWTVAGKVDSIQRPGASSRSPLKFRYGASGQRVSKQVGDFYCTEPGAYREHYIRDAQGNIMATYRYTNNTGASLKLNERPLYGSSRLGSLRKEVELHTLASFDPASANPVQQVNLNYELTDHLGNVCAVVTGRLLDGNGGGTAKQAELVSAQGYEAFGALLPGRNYSSDSYSRGFNGQDKDDEIYGATGTSYTAEFWQYDPRTGRRWNLDPVPQIGISDYAAFGLNPITNVDPNGAYFFGLIGSTSEQRKAADTYAAQNGGAVIDRHSKNIFVSYTERLSSPGATDPLYALRTQGFGKDGGLLPQHPVLDVPKTDWVDDWSGSDNFLAKASYGFLDKAFGAYQGTPIGAVFYSPSERRHLDGTSASQSEIEGAFFETAATLMPAAKGPGMFQRLNAAQFSKQFKGNLARMSAKSRGYANRAYNKGVDWLNKGKGAAKMAATQMGKLFTDDDAGEKQEE